MGSSSYINSDLVSIEDVETKDEIYCLNVHGNKIQTLKSLGRFTSLVELNLSSNCIQVLEYHALKELVCLQELDLSCNMLQSLHGLPLLPELQRLSVAYNRLSSLNTLVNPVKVPKLKYLDARENDLDNIADIEGLSDLPKLETLRLQDSSGQYKNPMCTNPTYPELVLELLETLKELDGRPCERTRISTLESVSMPRFDRISQEYKKRRGKQQTDLESVDRTLLYKFDCLERTKDRLSDVQELQYQVRIEQMENRIEYLEALNSRSERPKSMASAPEDDDTNLKHDCSVQTSDYTIEQPITQVVDTARKLDDTNDDKSSGISVFISTERKIGYCIPRIATENDEAIPEQHPTMLDETHIDTNRSDPSSSRLHSRIDVDSTGSEPLRSFKSETKSDDIIKATECVQKSDESLPESGSRGGNEDDTKSNDAECIATVRAQKAENLVVRLTSELMKHQSEHSARVDSATSTENVNHRDASIVANIPDESHTIKLQNLETKIREKDQLIKKAAEDMLSFEESKRKLEKSSAELQGTLREQNIEKEALVSHIKKVEEDLVQSRQLHLSSERNYKNQIEALEKCLQDAHQRWGTTNSELLSVKESLGERNLAFERLELRFDEAMKWHKQLGKQQEVLNRKNLENALGEMSTELRRIKQHAQNKIAEWKQRYSRTSAELREAMQLIEQHKMHKDKIELQMEELEKNSTSSLKHALQELQNELEETHNTKLKRLTDEVDTLRAENKRRVDDCASLQDELQKATTALGVKDAMLDDQAQHILDLKNETGTVQDEYTHELDEQQNRISELEVSLEDCIKEKSELEETLHDCQNQLEDVNERNTSLEAENKRMAVLKENSLRLESELKKKDTAFQFIEKELVRMRDLFSQQDAKHKERISQLREQQLQELGSLKSKLNIREVELSEATNDLATVQSELAEIRSKYEAAHQDLQLANERVSCTESEMKVLLVQIERERSAKSKHLEKIQALFQKLQQQ